MREERLMTKSYVIDPPIPPTVAVAGEPGRFPVRRIFCVGCNYAAHAREMGKDPDRELLFFFTKPADAVVDSGATVPYLLETSDFHYEIEIVLANRTALVIDRNLTSRQERKPQMREPRIRFE